MDLVLMFVVLAGHVASTRITFPDVKYVEPGREFELECGTTHGLISRIYSPTEEVPADHELLATSKRYDDNAFTADNSRMFTDYTDVSEEDEGVYTCVAFHRTEPRFETARCTVIVTNLCGDVQCPLLETCFPDYETGTYECRCDLGCPLGDADFLCTDRCEIAFHECAMRELICADKLPRTILRKGLCPELVEPRVRKVQGTSQVVVEEGELVTLSAGLLTNGVPASTITWFRNGEELEDAKNELVFIADSEWEGIIEGRILHCLNEDQAIVSRYNVVVEIPPTPSTSTGPDTIIDPPVYQVCSVFPGGVLEQFDHSAQFYHLACTHVLAANFLVDGDYSKGWYIYGTFDEHDGNTALSAMTFFVGNTGFEFSRGWIINVGGEKLEIEEDMKREVEDSGCYVTFSSLHLRAECPHFTAYYDGVMAGHIQLGGLSTQVVARGESSFGLCWDNNSGFRTNWQLQFNPRCSVSTGAVPCPGDYPTCNQHPLYPKIDGSLQPRAVYDHLSQTRTGFSCGNGATLSCSELNCGGSTLTPAQHCALNRADKVSCHLKMNTVVENVWEDDACPEHECDWKRDVLSRGCPQDNPPFQCGHVDNVDSGTV